MKFLSFTVSITLTIMAACFFLWMPERELIFLTPQDPLPEPEIEYEISESEWNRKVLTSIPKIDDNEAPGILARPSRDFEVRNYEDVKVSLEGNSLEVSPESLK